MVTGEGIEGAADHEYASGPAERGEESIQNGNGGAGGGTSGSSNKKILCPSLLSSHVKSGNGGGGDPSSPHDEEVVELIRDLAGRGDWDALVRRLLADPTEASLQDERGRTALHHACAVSDGALFPPTNVLRTIVDACTAACWTPDDFGWTPLSLACSNNAPEDVVRLLLDVHQAPVSMQTHCGMTPLYLATWSRAPMSVLEMLLEVGPGHVLWPTIVEETPLTLMWTESKDSLLMGIRDGEEKRQAADDSCSEEDWQRLELFLKAASHESIDDPLPEGIKFRALHSACSIGCPTPLVRAVMKRYPEQIWERDEYGRLPLTLAASAPVYEAPSKRGGGTEEEEGDDDDDAEEDDEDGDEYGDAGSGGDDEEGDSIDLEDMDEDGNDGTGGGGANDGGGNNNEGGDNSAEAAAKLSGSRPGDKQDNSLIGILLRANPTAAKVPDPYGRMPLYLAIESGKSWDQGLRSLFVATPEALTSRDAVTHMYPFMLAAVEDLQPLDVVYELLAASPQALKSCMASASNESSDSGQETRKK